MPRKKKAKETIKVTLLKNGYVSGKLYRAGDTVEVSADVRAYLLRTSPEVYS